MKKMICILTAALLLLGLCACGSSGGGSIDVVSREDGSGTRGAFVELCGITDADGNDATASSAEITNSTSVMIATVAGDKSAIGYASLGAVSGDVKALSVDGVEATVDNILSGTYTLARPFLLCYQDGSLTELAQDFRNSSSPPTARRSSRTTAISPSGRARPTPPPV